MKSGPCSGALCSNVYGSGCPASFGSVQFQGSVGPYTYSVSSYTSNLWSTRAATVDRLAIAETSPHRHLDQLIQISYLRSAGVNGAVNLLGTTSLTVQELSGLLVHDVDYNASTVLVPVLGQREERTECVRHKPARLCRIKWIKRRASCRVEDVFIGFSASITHRPGW
jgi:hypothetical protein